MKTKIKILLTLFVFIAHFAVCVQDTIVFSPFEKSQNIKKRSNLHVIEEIRDFLLADAYNEESGIFLLNKKTDVLYTIGFENLANSIGPNEGNEINQLISDILDTAFVGTVVSELTSNDVSSNSIDYNTYSQMKQ